MTRARTYIGCDLSPLGARIESDTDIADGHLVCDQRPRRLLLRAPGRPRHQGDQLTSVRSGARALVTFVDHRLRSAGARCDPIQHISTARTSEARQNASQWPHRYSPALEANTLFASGPRTRTWAIAWTVAVIAHHQRPPTSHATASGPIGITKPDVAPVTPSMR